MKFNKLNYMGHVAIFGEQGWRSVVSTPFYYHYYYYYYYYYYYHYSTKHFLFI